MAGKISDSSNATCPETDFLQRRHELAEPFGRDRLVQLGHHRGDRRVLLLCTVGEIVAAVDPPAERRVERGLLQCRVPSDELGEVAHDG